MMGRSCAVVVCLLFLNSVTQLEVSAASNSTSFEEVAAGAFTEIKTKIGTFSAKQGHAEVDDKHRNTGKQCLHIFGGDNFSVEFTPNKTKIPPGRLAFQAERWTRRTPFKFRIERLSKGKWKEIYNGDKQVVIGTFRTAVRIELDEIPIEKLRFSCTSPSKSGLLIDDIQLSPSTPQRVTSVIQESVTLPALVGTQASPLVRIRLDVEGTKNPVSITSVKLNLKGTTSLDDLENVSGFLTSTNTVRGGTNSDCFAGAKKLGEASPKAQEITITGNIQLQPGPNYLWLAASLKPQVNTDHVVQASCVQLGFSNRTVIVLQDAAPTRAQRIGVAVRKQGDDDSHTYRIPGLVTTNSGTLIGVYDVRRRGGGDLPGDIDVGMSRSTDGGHRWEAMRVIMDMGNDPKWNYDGIGDPAILVDRGTGTIWVAATWSHGNRSWRGSGPGLTPEETGQLMLVRSDDDGVTWSKPINITKQVKRPEWCFLLQGPGAGITMNDGTIVFAAQYQDPVEQKRLPHSSIIYSKDHGKTWQCGTGAFDDTTESQVAEIEPGVLMLNCRYNRASVRVVMTTRDMGRTWQEHPTSRRSLIEPRSCMASLLNVTANLRKKNPNEKRWLLFSNPDSTAGRERLTIKASSDNGLTWPKSHRLLLDEGRSAGYSCMAMIDEKTVGILYEGSLAHMTFQRIPLDDIVNQPKAKAAEKRPNLDTLFALRMPQVFGSHMVLQAGQPLPVWGQAKPSTLVSATLGKQKVETQSDADGNWRLSFPSRPVNNQPTTLEVRSGGERLVFDDILVGEVWLCAGQSNMEWPLSQTVNARTELANANRPTIRLLNLVGGARGSSGSYSETQLQRLKPNQFSQGKWAVASESSAASFSAVGWHFGRHLQSRLNTPIGLINPSVGGTPIEAWIRREALEKSDRLAGLVKGNWLDNKRMGDFCRIRGIQNLLRAIQAGDPIPGDKFGPNHSFKPGFMWDAGIKPLIPFAIRGVIWYQGESNAETASRVSEHGQLFPLLVKDWRVQWGLAESEFKMPQPEATGKRGDFPFLYVQLPALNRPEWPLFRDQQRTFLQSLDNVGMAITIDTGHPSNVHPTLKHPVGERLAEWALGTTYKQTVAAYSGPVIEGAEVKGNKVLLHFKHIGKGLFASDEKPIRHFEITGDDGKFHVATARVQGQTLVVESPSVLSPRKVRYAWSPFPTPPVNLVNSEGLPASPFQIDL
jgi:sialidase-1